VRVAQVFHRQHTRGVPGIGGNGVLIVDHVDRDLVAAQAASDCQTWMIAAHNQSTNILEALLRFRVLIILGHGPAPRYDLLRTT
jgi:hypothetical protein